MKFNEKWLREWVSPAVDTDTLVSQLTMLGLEVDGVESISYPFSNVIVAQIDSIAKHPDADKLKVCQVNTGSGICQIVCGAPNVYEGMHVPLALPGAVLGEEGNSFKIKKSKLRGVASEGMLCGAGELGFADKVDGLWDFGESLESRQQLGMVLEDYLQLDDNIIEVDLTPNRGDCLSLRGIAREVGTLNQTSFQMPFEQPIIEPTISQQSLNIELDAGYACSRYIGRYIQGVNINAQTPKWMEDKLKHAGVRCHDPIIDVTNYVLLELGQPMHAFDADKLSSEHIVVRWAKDNEWLTTLDGKKLQIETNTLVIADKNKPIALAGVMGGLETAVSETTTNIVFESAFFHPLAIAGRARQYGLHTDASHRFERGVDPDITELAIERATQLLIEIAGGEAGKLYDEINSHHQQILEKPGIEFKIEEVEKQLGCQIQTEQFEQWFTDLGFTVDKQSAQWVITPPSWRFDIEQPEDLIEEVARLYGYNHLPLQPLPAIKDSQSRVVNSEQQYRQQMVAAGFNEIISYSFISPDISIIFGGKNDSITVQNPLAEDMSIMRHSLIPGLVTTARYNLNRQLVDLKLFEIGQCFSKLEESFTYTNHIAGLWAGSRTLEHWDGKQQAVDFYDIKGQLESLLDGFITYQTTDSDSVYHPGQCAKVLMNGKDIGRVGAIHPKVLKDLDISQPLYCFEINLFEVDAVNVIKQYAPISAFPLIRRDVAFEIAESINVQAVFDKIDERRPRTLNSINVFDIYKGKGIAEGHKSVALSLIFGSDKKTLTDEEVQKQTNLIVDWLKQQFDIVMR